MAVADAFPMIPGHWTAVEELVAKIAMHTSRGGRMRMVAGGVRFTGLEHVLSRG